MRGQLTLDEMMLLACTHMLYRALPTVLVRTEPAFREVIATFEIGTSVRNTSRIESRLLLT